MSMPPHAIGSIPDETIRVARAAFPRGNMYLTMRDQLGTLYEEQNFAALLKRPGNSRWSACSNLLKGSLIAKQQRPCGAGSTGNMLSRWI